VPRIVWQGFTDPVANKSYVDRLTTYLNEVADADFDFEFRGISPPDYYVHRLTEWRCAVQALAGAIDAERDGVDGIILGHFQDAGLWELRSAVSVPVVGLGESAMLHALTLGYTFGLVTIDPNFVEWHEQQVRQYSLDRRCVGVRGMTTSVDLYMQAFAGDDAAIREVAHQFEALGRELADAGAEVLVPAGGLPALLLGTRNGYAIDGAVVLNANAIAAKYAEVAVKMRAISGTGPSRKGTFRQASAEALDEFVSMAAKLTA
jgi:allantoin racemase